MSKRSPLVDFGPLTLPVNASQDFWEPASMPDGVCQRDALKLQRLIKGEKTAGNGMGDDDVLAVTGDWDHMGFRLSTSQGLANAVNCLKLASSVAAATASIANRIELELSTDFLAGASLSVRKSCDGLHFDLRVADPESLGELCAILEAIASEVGAHLQVAVVLRLLGGPDASLIKEVGWLPDNLPC